MALVAKFWGIAQSESRFEVFQKAKVDPSAGVTMVFVSKFFSSTYFAFELHRKGDTRPLDEDYLYLILSMIFLFEKSSLPIASSLRADGRQIKAHELKAAIKPTQSNVCNGVDMVAFNGVTDDTTTKVSFIHVKLVAKFQTIRTEQQILAETFPADDSFLAVSHLTQPLALVTGIEHVLNFINGTTEFANVTQNETTTIIGLTTIY